MECGGEGKVATGSVITRTGGLEGGHGRSKKGRVDYIDRIVYRRYSKVGFEQLPRLLVANGSGEIGGGLTAFLGGRAGAKVE